MEVAGIWVDSMREVSVFRTHDETEDNGNQILNEPGS
jgi:hypothetical protein